MRKSVSIALLGLVTRLAVAQTSDIPLSNWTVPPYRGASASGGLSTMVDVTPGIGFVGVSPCRLVDTREAGYPAGYGAPPLTPGVLRSFDLNSDPLCPGIPAGVEAYSLNVTVTATAGPGHLVIYPQGGSQPLVSSINYVAGQTIANAVIVPAGTGGGVTVVAGVSATHLIIDINGYFTAEYNPGASFRAISNNVAPAILAENTSTASDAVAIRGVITTTTAGPSGVSAVQGFNQATNATGVGVWGKHNGGGWGVLGESATGFGVVATAAGTGSNAAVYARNSSTGVSSGVFGWANSLAARNYGIQGWSDSLSGGAAGVFGQDGSGPTAQVNGHFPAGVRGESHSKIGVLGLTGPAGIAAVWGEHVGGPFGALGYEAGTTDYGVYSVGNAHVQGTFTATNNKGFVQPHPSDASKEIRYISLEGPHTEVYFRGTAQVSHGVSRIPIPQHFRYVADASTYSTLVTPVGAMATVAVIAEGPEGIVVQASRNVKIHYVVYAEREAVRNSDPVIENVHFRPDPERDSLAHLPDTFRQLMIQNGTLNADGSVNMETARRLGWDKEWEKRERPEPQPASD